MLAVFLGVKSNQIFKLLLLAGCCCGLLTIEVFAAEGNGLIPFRASEFPEFAAKKPEVCTISTVAGTGAIGEVGDDGPALEATVYSLSSVAFDPQGNLFFTDYRTSVLSGIRKIDANGIVSQFPLYGSECEVNQPKFLAFDGADNLYFVDSKLDPAESGLPAAMHGIVCKADVQGHLSLVYTGERGKYFYSIALDKAGNLYIADTMNHRILKRDQGGSLTTVAGTGSSGFSGDGGPAVSAQLNNPGAIAFDKLGNLYISDMYNFRIRKVDTKGNIETVAGIGVGGNSNDEGLAVNIRVWGPARGMTVDAAGNLYLADDHRDKIRRVNAKGMIDTFAGTGEKGFSGDGGPAEEAQLWQPDGMTLDSAGNLYFVDQANNRIRKISCPKTSFTPSVRDVILQKKIVPGTP